MQASVTQVADSEIIAGLLQLARSGRFRKVGPLLRAAGEDFPNETAERIKGCLIQLGNLL